MKLFGTVWPDLDTPFDLDGYSAQMNYMEEINFSHSQFLSNVFIVNRRRFVEDAGIAGKGDLYRYITNTQNDVLGIIYCKKTISSQKVLAEVSNKMYHDANGVPFRLARQIIRENGGTAPVEW